MKRNNPEGIIQKQILDFLHYKKVVSWRNNNGSIFDPKIGIFRKANPYGIPGAPDIQGFHLGRPLCIEVKSQDGYASEDQFNFMRTAADSGAITVIARRLEDVEWALWGRFEFLKQGYYTVTPIHKYPGTYCGERLTLQTEREKMLRRRLHDVFPEYGDSPEEKELLLLMFDLAMNNRIWELEEPIKFPRKSKFKENLFSTYFKFCTEFTVQVKKRKL